MRTRTTGATLVLAVATASVIAVAEPKGAPRGGTPAGSSGAASATAPAAPPAGASGGPSAPTASPGAAASGAASTSTGAAAAATSNAAPLAGGAAPGAPSAAAAGESGGAAAPGAEAPAEPAGGPPPHYYVEPASPPGEAVYEPPPPPPPFYEPPPPAPPDLRAPKTALWLGVRPSLFVPFGSLWIDGFQSPSGVYYRRRTFANYAAPGPGAEFDAGARFSRRYMVFALYQHAELGTGNLDDAAFGGQERGATNFYGVGLRFSTDPAAIGFALEIALGYRDFTAYWSDGTKLSMTDGILDARIGLGADFRLSRHFTLDPMLVLGGGSFGSRKWSGSITEGSGFASTDEAGEYGTLELQLGAHFDVY